MTPISNFSVSGHGRSNMETNARGVASASMSLAFVPAEVHNNNRIEGRTDRL